MVIVSVFVWRHIQVPSLGQEKQSVDVKDEEHYGSASRVITSLANMIQRKEGKIHCHIVWGKNIISKYIRSWCKGNGNNYSSHP